MLPGSYRRPASSENGLSLASPRSMSWIPKSFARAGRHVWNDIKRPHGHMSHVAKDGNTQEKPSDSSSNGNGSSHPEISRPTNPRPISHAIAGQPPLTVNIENTDARHTGEGQASASGPHSPVDLGANMTTPAGMPLRSIQFADEPPGLRSAQARSPRAISPINER